MSDDYGYINARIRAMKSFLLKEEDYLGALRQRDPEGLIALLSNLPSYSNDFRLASTGQPASSVVDETLKLNLCRIFRRIIDFCEGQPRRLIEILVRQWDIYNLTTILRGVLNHKDKNEILQALIPAGKWDLKFLNKLAEAKGLTQLAAILIEPSGGELEKKFAGLLRRFSLNSPLAILENAFIEAYFKEVFKELDNRSNNFRIVLDYLSLKVDFLNILSILKKCAWPNLDIAIIKGGRIPEGFLEGLAKIKSIEEVLRQFQQTPYKWLGKEGLDLYRRTQRLSSLEGLLRNKLFWFCVHTYTHGDPLSMAIPLAFINFKETETTNLRWISKGLAFGIPEDFIKEGLTYYA